MVGTFTVNSSLKKFIDSKNDDNEPTITLLAKEAIQKLSPHPFFLVIQTSVLDSNSSSVGDVIENDYLTRYLIDLQKKMDLHIL